MNHGKMSVNRRASPLPPSKAVIKYKDLLEGIGHQIIVKIMAPVNKAGIVSSTYHHNLTDKVVQGATSRLKQLTGLITLGYTVIILILCLGMGLVYLIWPEEQHLIFTLMATALPFMVFFTVTMLICYLYLNRTHCLSSNTDSPRLTNVISVGHNIPSVRYSPAGSVVSSTSYDDDKLRSDFYHYKCRNIIEPPKWSEMDYTDIEDPKKDYTEIIKKQGQLGSTLEFLKYKD